MDFKKLPKRPLNPNFAAQPPQPKMVSRITVNDQPQMQKRPEPLQKSKKTFFKKPAKKINLKELLIWVSVIVVGLALGATFQFLPLGQIAIIIYGIMALSRHIPSKITFTAALATLTLAAVMAIIGYTGIIAQNFATYTFLLLIVGVVSAALELRRQKLTDSHITRKGVDNSF